MGSSSLQTGITTEAIKKRQINENNSDCYFPARVDKSSKARLGVFWVFFKDSFSICLLFLPLLLGDGAGAVTV